MKIKRYLLILSCGAGLALAADGQTDAAMEHGQKGPRFSPSLQKKVLVGTAALRTHAAETVGPLFDHNSKSWTIETADCPLVKSQVKGTGFKGHTVWVGTNDDGSFHIQLRTDASGTAVDAAGNKYLWIYNEQADLDTPDPTLDAPIVTGYAPGTFQLIPLATGGAGLTVSGYIQVDTPTPLNGVGAGVASAPLGCKPL